VRSRKKQGMFGVLVVALIGLLAIALPGAAAARDRNHDKIPDKWERSHHLSLHKNQAKRDQDRDNLKNRKEFKAGTNPRDADTDDDGVPDGETTATPAMTTAAPAMTTRPVATTVRPVPRRQAPTTVIKATPATATPAMTTVAMAMTMATTVTTMAATAALSARPPTSCPARSSTRPSWTSRAVRRRSRRSSSSSRALNQVLACTRAADGRPRRAT
jgi:cytoskeletal protein RodZ